MEAGALILLLKKDDASAMETIFRTYHASLCRIAFRIVRDEDLAKDIVQDVFIKIWRNRASIHIETSLEFYLKRAVINTALNYNEVCTRVKKETLHESHLISHHEHSDQLTASELKSAVDQAILGLPIRTRAVFTLVRAEEMSYRQVAESLDISVKAVEKEMMKALRLLRETLRQYLTVVSILASAGIL